jgi:hypothetical protein
MYLTGIVLTNTDIYVCCSTGWIIRSQINQLSNYKKAVIYKMDMFVIRVNFFTLRRHSI